MKKNQHIAAANGFFECVDILLLHGADPNIEGMLQILNILNIQFLTMRWDMKTTFLVENFLTMTIANPMTLQP